MASSGTTAYASELNKLYSDYATCVSRQSVTPVSLTQVTAGTKATASHINVLNSAMNTSKASKPAKLPKTTEITATTGSKILSNVYTDFAAILSTWAAICTCDGYDPCDCDCSNYSHDSSCNPICDGGDCPNFSCNNWE